MTAQDRTITYGQATPTLGVTYAGFVGTDTAASLGGSLVYTFVGISPAVYGPSTTPPTSVGYYTITPSGLTSDNYAITYAAGTYGINPVVVTTALAWAGDPSPNPVRAGQAITFPGALTDVRLGHGDRPDEPAGLPPRGDRFELRAPGSTRRDFGTIDATGHVTLSLDAGRRRHRHPPPAAGLLPDDHRRDELRRGDLDLRVGRRHRSQARPDDQLHRAHRRDVRRRRPRPRRDRHLEPRRQLRELDADGLHDRLGPSSTSSPPAAARSRPPRPATTTTPRHPTSSGPSRSRRPPRRPSRSPPRHRRHVRPRRLRHHHHGWLGQRRAELRRRQLDRLRDRLGQAPREDRHRHLLDHGHQGRRQQLRRHDLGGVPGDDPQGRPGDPHDHRPTDATYGHADYDITTTGGSGSGALSFDAGSSTACEIVSGKLHVKIGTGPARSRPPRPPTATTPPRARPRFAVTIHEAAQATLTITAPTDATYGHADYDITTTGGSGSGDRDLRRQHADGLRDRLGQAPRGQRHRDLHDHGHQGRRQQLRERRLGRLRGHDRKGHAHASPSTTLHPGHQDVPRRPVQRGLPCGQDARLHRRDHLRARRRQRRLHGQLGRHRDDHQRSARPEPLRHRGLARDRRQLRRCGPRLPVLQHREGRPGDPHDHRPDRRHVRPGRRDDHDVRRLGHRRADLRRRARRPPARSSRASSTWSAAPAPARSRPPRPPTPTTPPRARSRST